MKYVLSIGTNIGNKKENLQNAIESLNLIPNTSVTAVSSIYETEPVGYEKQDDFYNIAVEVESAFEPNEMLGVCLGIEAGLGRIRVIRFGPRIIDIDIIFAENMNINSKNLTIPHPRFNERKFVLIPILELYPNGKFFDIEFSKHIDEIKGQNIRKANENNLIF